MLAYPDPPVTTERLLLRPWVEEDVPAIVAATQDPEIPRFTRVPVGNTAADAREHILAQGPLLARGELLALMRVLRSDGTLVGPMALHHVDLEQRTAQVGYWTAAPFRGQGLTAGPLGVLARWALGPLGLERLELRADVENVPSQRVAERAGFVREGVLRAVELRKGIRSDQAVYGLLRSDLAA